MLKLAGESEREDILAFSQIAPIGVKISCPTSAYGLEGKMFSVWIQYNEDNQITALFSNFCGNCVLVSNDDADFEELSVFVNSSSFLSLCGNKRTFELCDIQFETEKLMFEFCGNSSSFDEVKTDGSIRSAYKLVCKSIPDSFVDEEENYLDFLSDFTYRRNRNLARTRIIENENNVLSCCFTAGEDEGRALISAVATDESCRGKGYGKRVVLTMADSIINENKKAYVIALNKSAEGFYKNIGFTQVDVICFK